MDFWLRSVTIFGPLKRCFKNIQHRLNHNWSAFLLYICHQRFIGSDWTESLFPVHNIFTVFPIIILDSFGAIWSQEIMQSPSSSACKASLVYRSLYRTLKIFGPLKPTNILVKIAVIKLTCAFESSSSPLMCCKSDPKFCRCCEVSDTIHRLLLL